MGSGVSQGPGLSHATVIYFLLVMNLARQSPLSGRLGAAGGDVSDGQAEHLLAPDHLSQERYEVGGALCPERLHAVSPPGAMYAGQEGAPPFGLPSPGAVRGTASRPPAAD